MEWFLILGFTVLGTGLGVVISIFSYKLGVRTGRSQMVLLNGDALNRAINARAHHPEEL